MSEVNKQSEVEINDIYIPYLEKQERYLHLYGGSGSGKSVFAAQKIILRTVAEKGHRFLCIRKVAADLRSSIFQLLIDQISAFGLSNEFRINLSQMRFTHTSGNEILLVGLDDVERLKSIVGITGIWVEEVTEVSDGDFDQLDLRLRGETENYKQIIFTYNPIDARHWLKKRFHDVPDGHFICLRTTFLDNHFIDDEYRGVLERKAKFDENFHRIYMLGEWGQLKTGAEFYHGFSPAKHIIPCTFNPDFPAHLTFDFNVVPYMTLLCGQVDTTDGKTRIKIFKEYCKKNPDNSSRAVCKYFARDHEQYKPVVFFYGDQSGKNRIAGQGNKRNFDDIEAELLPFLFASSDRVLSRNPNPLKARDFINLILQGYFEGINIEIDPECKELIADMENVKVGVDGKHKERVNDKELGTSYEKYGHTSDAMTYFIVSLLYDLYKATSGIG